MKYLIWILVVVFFFCLGGLTMGWAYTTDFAAKSGITYTEFRDGNAKCEQMSGETCNLYGGFAPLSQFTGH